MSARYKRIAESAVPGGVRFDVPRRNQGQMIEVAFGGFDRGEHDDGDLYKRISERGCETLYFKRIGERA